MITSLAEAKEKGFPVFAYGQFINDVINFLIVALVIFIIKAVNEFRKKQQEVTAPTAQEKLLTEIRDILEATSTRPRPGAV